jgi:hypothetical protein
LLLFSFTNCKTRRNRQDASMKDVPQYKVKQVKFTALHLAPEEVKEIEQGQIQELKQEEQKLMKQNMVLSLFDKRLKGEEIPETSIRCFCNLSKESPFYKYKDKNNCIYLNTLEDETVPGIKLMSPPDGNKIQCSSSNKKLGLGGVSKAMDVYRKSA